MITNLQGNVVTTKRVRWASYMSPVANQISCSVYVPKIVEVVSGGSRKKYLGGLAPHHLGGNRG